MSAIDALGGRLASVLFGCLLLAGLGCAAVERDWGDGHGAGSATGTSSGGDGGSTGGGGATGSGGATTGGGGAVLACSSGADCAAGFCVDGVCCDSSCDDLCSACSEPLTGMPDGTCGPALKATDPHNDCSKDGVPCGQTGFCDGSGACALQADPSIVCEDATCVGGVRTDAKTCDGAGHCDVGGTTTCAEGCNPEGSGCLGDCTDGSCSPGQLCDKVSGKCVDQTGQGEPCTSADQCQTGFCADGVCCDAACDGACRTCASGACAQAAAGSDLRGDCDATPASSCGTTGACDGAGSCATWGGGTECAPASCAGDTVTLAKTCDGAGTCVSHGTQTCANGCSGAGCAGGCTPGSCGPTEYCASSGVCAAKKDNGTTCEASDQCASGFCVDGRCCNSGCSGGCQQCNASGVCGNVGAGQDPKSACAAQSKSTCGTSGACDGSGACAKWADGTECAAATCSGTTALFAKTCNGAGSCVNQGSQTCTNGCNGDACAAACTSNSCAPTQYCAQSGACTSKKDNGASCGASKECTSGFCVDGTCCNSTCANGCQECSSGTCKNVVVGQDPRDACAAEAALACGGTGVCDGSGACAKQASGKVCVAATCNGDTPIPARTCDGSGTCKIVSPGTACVLYKCVAGACLSSCTTDNDCNENATCVNTQCKFSGGCSPACGFGYHCCPDVPAYCQKDGQMCN